jgi:2-furoate---CoA ligase
MVFEVVAMGDVPPAVRNTVRKVSVGGAPTPMSAKRALGRIFAGAEIIEAYGQTESTDGVTMARGTSVFDRPGTIGVANPHAIVAVQRADGGPADDDEEGEIVVGGPTVMAGYYRDRAASAAALREGWLHTGDRGRRDGDGFFFITGRMKDLIITGGENVSPVEIESCLSLHPDVLDVAVAGLPDERWGKIVAAFVIARGTVTAEALDAHCRQSGLADFKRPRRYVFLAELPKSPVGKLLRRKLVAGEYQEIQPRAGVRQADNQEI